MTCITASVRRFAIMTTTVMTIIDAQAHMMIVAHVTTVAANPFDRVWFVE